MAKIEIGMLDVPIISEALVVYGHEIGKMMKKAEKLGIKEASSLKQTYLGIAALRDRITK